VRLRDFYDPYHSPHVPVTAGSSVSPPTPDFQVSASSFEKINLGRRLLRTPVRRGSTHGKMLYKPQGLRDLYHPSHGP
ncbi:hypothetical protein K438DRAFT_1849734, partial [Mycena galopus ATCC 62051]